MEQTHVFGLSDDGLAARLAAYPDLDMRDYEPLTNRQYKALLKLKPNHPKIAKWL